MQIIMPANNKIIKILGSPKAGDDTLRPMCYVVEQPVEQGVLLFHMLTRALVLLSREEYDAMERLPALRELWFLVPQALDDRAYADRVRFVLANTTPKPSHITSYTIFTTMDCNARCFYCYEKGRPRTYMTEATARKTADFIASNCGGEAVRLHWFGGEPLLNFKVMDIICEDLAKRDIAYTSVITSNGYLFTDETVKRAVDLWHLKQVQITLDGTQAVYNRSKAYIYAEDTNPFQTVIANIDRLLHAGVRVCVRMNMDTHNSEDLFCLTDDLQAKFGSQKGFKAYSHVLFEFTDNMPRVRQAQARQALYEKQEQLIQKLIDYHLYATGKLSRQLKINHCMADHYGSLTVTPDGNLGVCEHFTQDHFVGCLDTGEVDLQARKCYCETHEIMEACTKCFYYPACIRLKICTERQACFPQVQALYLQSTKAAMLAAYHAWCKKEELQAKAENASD